MIKPPQTTGIADRVASQSWQLVKSHLELKFSQLNSTQPHSLRSAVSIQSQSVSLLLTKILPDLILSINQKPNSSFSSAKIDQVILGYRATNAANSNSLKSIYMIEKLTRFFPLISKLQSVHIPLLQTLDEGFFMQPNVVVASFPFPHAPISSEYFKYFELFQRRDIPSQRKSKTNKKKQKGTKNRG